MGSSPDINYPQQPSYGEGMADAMKAQMQQLLGQGEYAGMYADAGFAGGNLGDIIAGVEAPIRQKTAQVDTDVLRQTLLGNQTKVVKDPETGKYGIPNAEVVKGEDGKAQTAGDGRYQMVLVEDGTIGAYTQGAGNLTPNRWSPTAPTYALIDTETGGVQKFGGQAYKTSYGSFARFNNPNDAQKWLDENTSTVIKEVGSSLKTAQGVIDNAGGDTNAATTALTFTNPNTGEPLREGEVVREGDGMIDLLGDKRKALDPTTGLESDRMAGFDAEGNFLGLSALAEDIQRGNLSRQREADLADVERLSDRFQTVMEDYKPGTTSGLDDARLLLEQQRENLTGLREATQADVDAGTATAIGEMIQTGRGGPVTIPTGSTYGGDITASKMNAAQVADPLALKADTSYKATAVADPMALTAATSYDPSASVTGDGYTATAGLEGGNIGADSLRAALLTDAETALGQGLTEREQASISNAARARSGLMGRTFDQSGAIAEAQALVAENNARRMQNRGFAQTALGQEADIQRDDLGRGLQASMQNQAALNRAAEFGASQGMQAQLANQAATNQALSQGLSAGLSQEALAAQQAQAKAMADATATNRASEFGVSAGMEQDALRAQLGQQTSLAQAQMDQQANAFDADAAMRAATVNQGQQQQAAQFGVGAQMDAERLNEQLRQQGLGNYINAVGNLAQIEDSYTLDPFQALLGRGGGGSLQAGQGVFGQAGYGLQSGPQYLNPESGLGYISNMAANEANMYAANVSANASRNAGLMGGLGALGGGLAQGIGAAGSVGAFFCWVAREVYGPANPAWLQFREWMFTESPNWFFKLYAEYGERFANWISDKPRIKSIIRKWMDSKIGGK
jgi:hypothetical protein